ncbi:hypothetical protein FS837_012101 [Tulasnella sp. UAMH 9824]|nr:hypothetical protein FS837_012101 [Tulasnella sp. UAMH 9824]
MGVKQSRFSHSRSASGCDLSFQTQLHFYYALARTLKNGSQAKHPRRGKAPRLPPLPLEVVHKILREAQCIHPHPSIACKWKAEPDAFLNDTGILFRPHGVVGATSAEPERKLLFASPKLDKEALSRMASVRVVTSSKDQGWHTEDRMGSSGSWSWFELGIVHLPDDDLSESGEGATSILSGDKYAKLDARTTTTATAAAAAATAPPPPASDNNKPLRWVSHYNEIASQSFQRHIGNEFGPDHDIWKHLEPGDRIGVWICAQFVGWECYCEEARILVREWYAPQLV